MTHESTIANPIKLGTIYGLLLSDPAELAYMGAALHQPPYLAPPKAPVLYIKTANTVNCGSQVRLDAGINQLEIGATLGLVISRNTPLPPTESAPATAADVSGVLLLADWCIPHESIYRPPLAQRNRDGYLGVGEFLPASALSLNGNLSAVLSEHHLTVSINGALKQTVNFSSMLRKADQLLADVSAMFTLRGDAHAASDVLMLGLGFCAVDSPRPAVKVGERVEITLWRGDTQLSTFSQTLVHHAAHALPERPPKIECKTPSVFCLAINYADHAKELAFKPPMAPLVFLKSANAIRSAASSTDVQHTPHPLDVKHMHYECELAVVIGKTAKNVAAADAYDYVEGYTVANDFAIRDYLENYYRPNLRVKNRDSCTPMLGAITPASSIADPMNLTLTTRVNGIVTQSGNTCDMIFGVPALIEYLSSFMTLSAGDIILTGTPDGVVDCKVGDLVECEIERLGAVRTLMVDMQ